MKAVLEVTELQVERGDGPRSGTPEPQGSSSTSSWYLLTPWAVRPEEQEEVSSDSCGPWTRDRPEGVCGMLGLRGAWVALEQSGCGEWEKGAWRGRKPSLAMPSPSRKHLCLFGQAVGRGPVCGVATATNQRWFLRAEGKQSPWLLGCAPGVMGQLWNILGSEGQELGALDSVCEAEGMGWRRAQEEPAVTKAGPSWATGTVSSPGKGSWGRDFREASALVKLVALA